MIKVEGLEKVTENFNKLLSSVKEYSRQTMQEVCLDLKGKAQECAPVDEGDLRGSGFYRAQEDAKGITATVGFNKPYALKQHEELGYNHPKGGQAKYLESPLIENQEQYFNDFKNSIGDAIK